MLGASFDSVADQKTFADSEGISLPAPVRFGQDHGCRLRCMSCRRGKVLRSRDPAADQLSDRSPRARSRRPTMSRAMASISRATPKPYWPTFAQAPPKRDDRSGGLAANASPPGRERFGSFHISLRDGRELSLFSPSVRDRDSVGARLVPCPGPNVVADLRAMRAGHLGELETKMLADAARLGPVFDGALGPEGSPAG